MLDSKTNLFLKIDNEMIDELKSAQRIDLYLIKDITNEYKLYHNTFLSNCILIKADNKLYRVEGIAESFESQNDEVFAITIKRGWLNIATDDINGDKSHIIKEILFSVEDISQLNLIHYYSFTSNNDLKMEVYSTIEKIYITDIEEKNVILDRAIILKEGLICIYIGLEVFPYSILVTMDDLFIKKLI